MANTDSSFHTPAGVMNSTTGLTDNSMVNDDIIFAETITYDMTMKPKDINWISDEIETKISPFKPDSLSNTDIDPALAEAAFASIFYPSAGPTFVWFNQYQVEQTARKVASWYGFSISSSSHTIFCSCGKPHTPLPKKVPTSNDDFYGVLDEEQDETEKKRKRTSISSLACPFRLHVSHIKPEHRSLKMIAKPVKIMSVHFKHNHTLNKQMLIKAKMATHQYVIPPKACHTMLKLIEDGPILPLHLKNFLKQYYPDSQAISPQMMFNFRLKCKDLELKYGSLGNVPPDKANKIFDPSSLESAPEHWDTNPIYSQTFKDAMQEVLIGPADEFNGQIAVVRIMEKVKECQRDGFDYRVFYADDNRPAGMMYMTPYQIRQFLRYGDILALDCQLKRKNTYGWVFCGPAGTNNNKKLVHFAHAFMLGFAEFLMKSMSEISRRPLSDIKLIAMDGKFDQYSFREVLPGKFLLLK